jgi:hypothetical protein
VFECDLEVLVLVAPRRRLALRAPRIDGLTALTILGDRGSGALTSSLLRGLDPQRRCRASGPAHVARGVRHVGRIACIRS